MVFPSHQDSDAGLVLRLNLDRPRLSRTRAVQSCQQCRSRKIRCDRSKPQCRKCAAHHRHCLYISGSEAEKAKACDSPGRPTPTTELESGENLSEAVPIQQQGHLAKTDSAQTRYYSSASWVAAVEDDAQSWQQSFLGQLQQPSDIATEKINGFLQQAEVDQLISWYSQYCHFWYPVVDIAEVTTSLQNLRVHGAAPPGSLALIMAICYAASRSAAALGTVKPQSLISSPSWGKLADQLLHSSDYPRRPNLNTIRAAFLLAAPSITEHKLAPDPGPVCILLRAAQSLGLHRDPCSFHLSSPESEIRRLLWWSVYGLDTSYSTAHAVPPLVHPASYDVAMLVDRGQLECKLLITRNRVNLVLSKVLHDIYGINQPTRQKIQLLDEEARSICADEMAASHQLQTTALERFISACQRMCCWKVIYILHQPYLRCLQWPQTSREKTLHACREYIKLFLSGITDPDFKPYRWVLDHFNVRHACAIVLQDLIQYPNTSESEGLRGLAESCFSTFSADAPDWPRLDALRSKAWDSNRWSSSQDSNALEGDESLSDWDPLFASFIWDDLLLS